MVFSSNIFLFLFLPLTLFLYFAAPEKLVGKKYKNYLLLLASLLFYAWGEPQYLVLLIVSIVGNYFFGLAIEKKSRDFYVTVAIAFNLLLLGYFKYANFLVENLNHILPYQITLAKVHLPIGISFFTFHAISYLVDIYRKKSRAQKNIFDLALYIAFFPQLIAGPIVRYNFIEKYLTKRRHNLFFVAYGIRRFLIGLGKKVIIANPLGEVADVVFALPAADLSTPLSWFGIICYTLQIYFDFSGYSDMAIGLARICGFKFPENFNYPYISRSIKEFWRRWHMSLSAWFRDYVYIPLGGNRVSLSRQYFNLVLVFFLCGLWHGASWNFIIWGMFHGFFLVAERIVPSHFVVPKFLQYFYAIFVVIIGWVFFRSPDLSHALNYLHTMFGDVVAASTNLDTARLLHSHFVWMSFALAIIGFSPLVKNISLKLIRKNKTFFVAYDIFLIGVFVFAIIRISASTHNPFIYFQF
ncbi:MAG: MBOAT family protein [Proteobacteria bacterium]|nr:MBOAT family protein [Pseudomonadota bacterium]